MSMAQSKPEQQAPPAGRHNPSLPQPSRVPAMRGPCLQVANHACTLVFLRVVSLQESLDMLRTVRFSQPDTAEELHLMIMWKLRQMVAAKASGQDVALLKHGPCAHADACFDEDCAAAVPYGLRKQVWPSSASTCAACIAPRTAQSGQAAAAPCSAPADMLTWRPLVLDMLAVLEMLLHCFKELQGQSLAENNPLLAT